MTILNQVSTSNAFSTTLNGSIGSGDTTITLNSTTGLQTPGVLTIDRQDGSGNNTPTLREYITFTGINGSQLTGVARGVAGSTAQSHNSGALAEETMTVTHWANLYSVFTLDHTTTGTHVIGTATISNAIITTFLSASGASITGNFPITPVWVMSGYISGTTTSVGKPLSMPQPGNWSWFSFVTPWVASAASVVFDVKKNGTSIFAGITTPAIIGGGTFVSTASINTKAFVAGDVITVDVKSNDNPGIIRDVVGQARAY